MSSSLLSTDTVDLRPAHADLAGPWICRLDPDAVGERDGWFSAPLTQDTHDVVLPGSVQHQGIGDEISVDTPWTGGIVDRSFFTDDRYAPYRAPGDVSVPFWLQPRVYYRGPAWFQRAIDVPATWEGHDLQLTLERVHWESAVWVDDNRIGSENSLTTAHRYVLGRLRPGRHLLTIRVDNRTIIDVGPNAHSVTDHTQGNWNGIIGDLTITPLPAARISGVRVIPDVAARRARVAVDILAGSAGVQRAEVRLKGRCTTDEQPIGPVVREFTADYGRDVGERGVTATGGHLDIDLDLGSEAKEWDEFSPAVYELTVELAAEVDGQMHRDEQRTVFGLREIAADGTQLTLNGRPLFLRGTLESCVFPLTGHPPTDIDAWRRIAAVVQAHGLNLLRFHSWCPPRAAFHAADEAGLYLQVEGPVWANQGAALGEGRPVDGYLQEETRRILHDYGNHPSFVMMAHGNEPGGRDAEYLASWVEGWRTADPRRLYTSGAGWPAIEQNDFDNIPGPRTHRWGEGLQSRLNATAPDTLADYSEWVASRDRPIISHEVGQWCVYPDFDEMKQYTGLMQARNFRIFRDLLEQAGMGDQAADFLDSSGRLQVLCYKEEIESALRTENFGGFHLLGVSDFPGQGTALVGVLNPFWESKRYCTPEQFARFCGPTVPLAHLPRRLWREGEDIDLEVQIAHFGAAALEADIRWSLRDDAGREIAGGDVARDVAVPLGNATRIGPITVPTDGVAGPAAVNLAIQIADRSGTVQAENDWDLWIYPAAAFTADGAASADDVVAPEAPVLTVGAEVRITGSVDEAIALATDGHRVLFEVPANSVANNVALGFTPVFWNTAWTSGQEPHTLGLLHDPNHPVFADFPTDGYTNWQWWDACQGARALVLDGLPTELRPVVQPIDTWFEARRLGALVEARVGNGSLMVSSLNLSGGPNRPAARQLRTSLLRYLRSEAFDPSSTLTGDEVARLLQ